MTALRVNNMNKSTSGCHISRKDDVNTNNIGIGYPGDKSLSVKSEFYSSIEYIDIQREDFKDVKEIIPLTPKPLNSPTSPRTVSLGKINLASLKGALNRPRNSKHLKKLSEMNISPPEANEPILFESKVAKWSSSALKKSSNKYLILTRNSLCAFKSADKAAKIFDGLPLCTLPRKLSADSSSSLDTTNQLDSNAKTLPAEHVILCLATIFAITEQLTPEPHIRIDHMSSLKKQVTVSITAPDLQKHRQWLTVLRSAVHNAGPIGPLLTYDQRTWIMNKLSSLDDLSDENERKLVAYRVLLKSLSDEDQDGQSDKDAKTPVLLILGKNNFYIIPSNLRNDGLPSEDNRKSNDYKINSTKNSNLIKEIDFWKYKYPLLCITDIRSNTLDDTFMISFKNNINFSKRTIVISSLLSDTIITEIKSIVNSITFWWTDPSYKSNPMSPISPVSSLTSPTGKISQETGIGRMIEAQCHVLNISKSRISFHIEYVLGFESVQVGVDNLPFKFVLLPPKGVKNETYTNNELMAIFNSLKYHPLLLEIVLSNINLFELQIQPSSPNNEGCNMLATVLYGLLISNSKLKTLNLSSCGITSETITEIGNALFTGKASLDRLILSDSSITRESAQALANGIMKHSSSIKELDISNCKLNYDGLMLILQALYTKKPEELESLNLSNNICDVDEVILIELFSRSKNLRSLNIRNCLKFFTGSKPIISLETFNETRLTTLDFGGIPLNNKTHLLSLYAYIRSPAFAKVKYFSIDHCNLDGEALAIILSYITTSPNYETIRVWAGGNFIAKTPASCKEFCYAVRNDWTPVWLSLENSIIGSNAEQVVEILSSFCENTVIKYLDLSNPQFISNETVTQNSQMTTTIKKACDVIGKLFKTNNHILELNLRGNSDRKWGPSLGTQLLELEDNAKLEKLNIEGNSIGDQGIKSLSEALKRNVSLKSLRIDRNEIGIEGYVSLHQVLISRQNTTLQNLGYPLKDLQTHNENLDAKLTTTSPISKTISKANQKIISEKQKGNFKQIIDEIMFIIEENSYKMSKTLLIRPSK
ncbi:17524_t:CDS:2 [Dentiscutata erythropus]|uniref:17524_t:CDS:1 n=1 Tax=Dentiscutata erythropus TaxID=1348616 RepID=A0A9N9H1F4_9GLOM|nr:17524_t:CDS:2 [Dentiscutata erythropus]